MIDETTRAVQIATAVLDRYGILWPTIKGRSRTADIVRARHAAMWAVRHYTHLSYPQIGRLFDRDHSTIIHAVSRIDGARRANSSLRRILDEVR